ncbi:MAG: hypothetical protein J5677_04235 [Bacteroidales bacterium]|nr:hypothetical protein [Bacteroidales bacterium]
MKKNRQNYEAPTLTVVEFRIERGYAESTFNFGAVQKINNFVNESLDIQMNNGSDGNFNAGFMVNQEDHSNDVSGSWSYANGSWF